MTRRGRGKGRMIEKGQDIERKERKREMKENRRKKDEDGVELEERVEGGDGGERERRR